MSDQSLNATACLATPAAGEALGVRSLMAVVYNELRVLAASYMKRERPEHTLTPTALVHESYLRLVDISRIDWRGKTHFFAMAAVQMRRVLVDHARARYARKRVGDHVQVTLDEAAAFEPGVSLDVLALREALERLARLNPRQGRVVELRFFGGLTVGETAFVLGVSPRTVKGDWWVARAWLLRELG